MLASRASRLISIFLIGALSLTLLIKAGGREFTTLAAKQPPATATYSITELGHLPGSSSTAALGLNNPGRVVGRSGGEQGSGRAFLWTRGGGMQSLETLPGGSTSQAVGINDSDQVVGFSNTATSLLAFLWTSSDGMRSLGTLPDDTSSQAFAINNAGQVVGASIGMSGGIDGSHAFLWTSSGGMQSLGTLPGGTDSVARAINSSGQAAGWATVGDNERAFFYSGGPLLDLGALPGDSSSLAFGINDASQVVGRSGSAARGQAFLWTSGGGMQAIQALPGANFSEALDINNRGQAVGSTRMQSLSRAFVWTSGGGMQDLNPLIPGGSNATLTVATAINDSGQITAIDSSRDGPLRAYLLTPVVTGSAAFIARDDATQGNWRDRHGVDGAAIANDASCFPGYVEASLSNHRHWTWADPTGDPRALRRITSNNRLASTWFAGDAFSLDLNFTDNRMHQVALYCLDWDDRNRAQVIEVLDANGVLLDSQTLASFVNGVYLVWNLGGRVRIRITRADGDNAVLSGVFFDTRDNGQ